MTSPLEHFLFAVVISSVYKSHSWVGNASSCYKSNYVLIINQAHFSVGLFHAKNDTSKYFNLSLVFCPLFVITFSDFQKFLSLLLSVCHLQLIWKIGEFTLWFLLYFGFQEFMFVGLFLETTDKQNWYKISPDLTD